MAKSRFTVAFLQKVTQGYVVGFSDDQSFEPVGASFGDLTGADLADLFARAKGGDPQVNSEMEDLLERRLAEPVESLHPLVVMDLHAEVASAKRTLGDLEILKRALQDELQVLEEELDKKRSEAKKAGVDTDDIRDHFEAEVEKARG